MHYSKITKSKDIVLFNAMAYIFLTIGAAFCIVPVIVMISASVTDEVYIAKYGISIIPRAFSLDAYRMAFKIPETMIRAYGVTIFVTLVGTAVSLFLSAMTAYVLQRKDFPLRNHFAFFFYFTTIFSGGLAPWYLLIVKDLHLKNNLLALILPYMINIFYIIIIRSFISTTIPDEVTGSAKIDGAGDFRIFMQIILPLSKPILATIGLFIALIYWNDWYLNMLFIDNTKLYTLQYYLYALISRVSFLEQMARKVPSAYFVNLKVPKESFKMAMAVLTMGPIMALYPFLQKYFVKGITIGAVKG